MSQYAALRANVGLLGTQLGDTVRNQLGPAVLERIEQIRHYAKQARQANDPQDQQLKQLLASLTDDEILPVARAFAQFLNLANLAEQHHTISKAGASAIEKPEPLLELLQLLKTKQVDVEKTRQAVADLSIELVLTAHPTEVTRRTLIYKLTQIADCLAQREQDLSAVEQQRLEARLPRFNYPSVEHQRNSRAAANAGG